MKSRKERLMPGGVPRWIRCYDNGGVDAGGSGDRYTVCFTGRRGTQDNEAFYRAMSERPFHPQGIGLWMSHPLRHCDVNRHGFAPAIGRKCHLGRRIPFKDLPPDCRKLVLQDYKELWNIK